MNKNTKTILIVEDSPTQAARLRSVLSQCGLATIWARTGEEGLSSAQSIMPDAIVLDIELPGISGLQVCKSLKENMRTAAIPVILLTHFKDAETIKLGLDIGAVEFIPKDVFSDVVLVETLRQKGLITAK